MPSRHEDHCWLCRGEEAAVEDEAYRLNAIHDADEFDARLSWRTV